MRVVRTTTIHRRPQDVFTWIEDPRLATRWQPEVAEYEITEQRPEVLGTEFREVLRGRGGRGGSVELRGRVTAYTPDHRMDFDLDGPRPHVHTSFTLTPVPEGTELRVELDLTVSAWLAPAVRGRVSRRLEAELRLLRTLCEQDGEDQRANPHQPDSFRTGPPTSSRKQVRG
ncbi:hypothetical protein GCM10009733_059340 [Nonomuraea maheshkhaliensis]|uniref:SRPBCC family protein n=1 Tax=Nonomuraea maheshkhaliensis TaxID=419590 RepID=A0ABN2FN11_9ACTN